MTAPPTRQKEPATWELVLKRNPVERLKQAKAPLGIRDELPALIAMGYESVPEEDVVRLQWWGLYHDKPKVGTFMLRLKIPSGILPPAKLRAIGEVSNRYGRGDAELSTRQCISSIGFASRSCRTCSRISTRRGSRPPAAAVTR